MVKLNSNMDQMPKLTWHPVIQNGQNAGETLVAAELILKNKARILYLNSICFDYIAILIATASYTLSLQAGESDLPLVPPKRAENLYMVPQGIRPVVQLTAVEVTDSLQALFV